MWSLLPKATNAIFGTLGKFGKRVTGSGVASKIKHGMEVGHINTMIKAHLVFSGVALAFGQGSPSERLKNVAVGTFWMWSTLGMNSGWRQAVWGVGIGLAPHADQLARGLIGGYRSGLAAQTSAAIPFSHSQLNMNQAYATLSYARQRMSESYGHLGSEAAVFAARYLRRN